MNAEQIDTLIGKYQAKLAELQPTLKPRENLPYAKFILFNVAKKKEAQYKNNLNWLYLFRKNPEKITEETLKELLV
jgi:hypothetical protein